MKKAAIKFCGGCDPVYDRVEYWETIRQAASDSVEWVEIDDPDCGAILLIAGCPRMCPRRNLERAVKPIVCIKDGRTEPQTVIERLLSQ